MTRLVDGVLVIQRQEPEKVAKADRERTPLLFAQWLVALARRADLHGRAELASANTAAVLAECVAA